MIYINSQGLANEFFAVQTAEISFSFKIDLGDSIRHFTINSKISNIQLQYNSINEANEARI